MGYRSEVSIVMTKDLFGKIYKDIPVEMNELIGMDDCGKDVSLEAFQ